MIRQVVFDFGQVLVRYEPAYMTAVCVADPADRKAVEAVVFDRLYWDRLDAGTIEDEEILAGIRSRLPARLWAEAEQTYCQWYNHLPPVPGMAELAARLRARGIKTYVLSNISRGFAAHADEFPVLAQADGCVFSGVCGFVKPQKEIYAYLCERFGLRPEETVFVDDNARNVAGAQDYGIHGYLFDGDAAKLERYLEDLLQ